MMRQQLADLPRSLRRQPHHHIFEISIMGHANHARRLDQAHDRPPIYRLQRRSPDR